MAIKQIQMDFAGQVGVSPRLGRMISTDTLATITTAGYLNNQPNTAGISFLPGDFLFAAYNDGAGGIEQDMFSITISNTGIITLTNDTAALPAFISGITLGQSAPNKALTLDGSSNIDSVAWAAHTNAASLANGVVAGTSGLGRVLSTDNASALDGVPINQITSAGDICNVPAGTSAPNKAIILDGSSLIDSTPFSQLTNAGAFCAPITASPQDVNLLDNMLATVVTSSVTPGVATCDASFIFEDSLNLALNYSPTIMVFSAKASGAFNAPLTSVTAVTGAAIELVTGLAYWVQPNPDGTIDMQISAAPGIYYLGFTMPNGRVVVSSPLTITGP